MNAWINPLLDLTLIALVGAGLVQATRLIRHLAGLQQGRTDMQRFVREFNTTVQRAEAGIKGLRQAARDSGDDLEKLVEKGHLIRDELHYLVESADKIASRLSQNASSAVRRDEKPDSAISALPEVVTPLTSKKPPEAASSAAAASRAERELMQALEKLG